MKERPNAIQTFSDVYTSLTAFFAFSASKPPASMMGAVTPQTSASLSLLAQVFQISFLSLVHSSSLPTYLPVTVAYSASTALFPDVRDSTRCRYASLSFLSSSTM